MQSGDVGLDLPPVDLHVAITKKERSSRYLRTAIDYLTSVQGQTACDAFLEDVGIARDSSIFQHIYNDENWNSYELEVYLYDRFKDLFADPYKAVWECGVASGAGHLDQKDTLFAFKIKIAPVKVIVRKASEHTERLSRISECHSRMLTRNEVQAKGKLGATLTFNYTKLPPGFKHPHWTSIVLGYGVVYGLFAVRKGLRETELQITHWPILPSDLPSFQGVVYRFDRDTKDVVETKSGHVVANVAQGPFSIDGVVFNNGQEATCIFEYQPESLWTLLGQNTWQRPRLRREERLRELTDRITTELTEEHQAQLARYEKELREKIAQIERLKVEQEEKAADLQKANDKLLEMDQLKTNFFANISHELRTPLTLILSPMESMLQGEAGNLDSSQREFVAAMHRNAQKLLKLINNLLDFSKLEAGRMSVDYREVDLVAFVQEHVSAFASAAAQVGLELKVSAAQSKVRAFVDTEKMEKILLNLISNAFKFTNEGGIYVEVAQTEGEAEIVVRDTGIGIPTEKLLTIFERFSQLDGSASRRYEGTGIGLALARELAQVHGGTLVASSVNGNDESGHGAVFTLRFPRFPEELRQATGFGREEERVQPPGPERDGPGEAEAPRRSASRAALLAELDDRRALSLTDESGSYEVVPEEGAPVLGAETVLVVEDTHDMRRFLYFLLRPHFTVVTARNGREGLAKAARHLPDLIVSDVMMPEMDGYQLLVAVRADARIRDTPVILLTAKADIAMKIEGLDLGADDYVIKPFNSRELLSRIRSQLRMRHMTGEIRTMRDQLAAMNERLTGQVQLQVSELIRNHRLQNYLSPQLLGLVQGRDEPAVQSERKKLSIFFSDIVDFTRISEALQPEDLGKILNHYLSEMTAIARRYNATVDKFIGDAIVCHFGDVGSLGERGDAVACVQMAVEMQKRMRELAFAWVEAGFDEPLRIRCGINTGFAAVGNFGSSDRMDYTVIGSHVNLASRIQSAASPGGILISHSTWALVRSDFVTEGVPSIRPKGFTRDIPVYEVRF